MKKYEVCLAVNISPACTCVNVCEIARCLVSQSAAAPA
jgi:hypothetical protein